MTELLWFGAAFLIVFTGIVVGCKIANKKKKKKTVQNPIVTLTGDFIRICWNGHNIVFNFSKIDNQLWYDGADCDEAYSCSLSSTGDKKLPWKVWVKIGEDELTMLTDIKNNYEII